MRVISQQDKAHRRGITVTSPFEGAAEFVRRYPYGDGFSKMADIQPSKTTAKKVVAAIKATSKQSGIYVEGLTKHDEITIEKKGTQEVIVSSKPLPKSKGIVFNTHIGAVYEVKLISKSTPLATDDLKLTHIAMRSTSTLPAIQSEAFNVSVTAK